MYLTKQKVYVSEISGWPFLERYIYALMNDFLMLELDSRYAPRNFLNLSIKEIFLILILLCVAAIGWFAFPILAIERAVKYKTCYSDRKYSGYYTSENTWVLIRGPRK